MRPGGVAVVQNGKRPFVESPASVEGVASATGNFHAVAETPEGPKAFRLNGLQAAFAELGTETVGTVP